jgi:hypothetical protein
MISVTHLGGKWGQVRAKSAALPIIAPDASSRKTAAKDPVKTDVIRMQLAGAAPGLKVTGEEQLPGTANYFIGNDPAKWHSSVQTYAKVRYAGVYPGIDLVYYGNQRQLEYDFVVAPGTDPKQIRLHFAGAKKLRVDSDGDLSVWGNGGEIAFHKPLVYQAKGGESATGQRSEVDGKFVLLAGNSVQFALGRYDRTRELVIDPTLEYSTYLGGGGGTSGSFTDNATAIATDASGNTYVVGYTWSVDFPVTSGSLAPADPGVTDGFLTSVGFVTKLNAAGNVLIYSTYIGGNGSSSYTGNNLNVGGGDFANGIIVDNLGNAYLTGAAWSGDFPVTNGAFQAKNNAFPYGSNAWIAKLNPSGTELIYSTYLGGSGGAVNSTNNAYGDSAAGIAVNALGYAYVTGNACSTDFPVTQGAFQTMNKAAANNACAAWVSEVNQQGTGLVYSTYLSGSGNPALAGTGAHDKGFGIVVDGSGSAYVGGETYSSDFPITSGAFQETDKTLASKSTQTGFVAKLNPTGSALVYSTYLGGSVRDFVWGIKVDPSGNAYVTGASFSADFPITNGAFQTVNKAAAASLANGFVAKINSTGTNLLYSTFLGGSGNGLRADQSEAIRLDASGNTYVTGYTDSADFPVTSDAFQSTYNSNLAPNAFVTELNNAGTNLVYSTYIGGSGDSSARGDVGTGIALDSSGNVYIAGTTYSGDFPVTPGAFQTVNHGASGGNSNAFISKFAFGTTVATPGLQFIPVTPCRVVDTRGAAGPFGGPELSAAQTREFDIPQSACNIPSTAVAYSLNVTVVPNASLNYLTLWPTGLAQPNVSTLNSDGRVKANAAITPAGTNGGVDVFVSDASQVILDIDGYFVPAGTASALAFYPVTPCRIADTRGAAGPLGGPSLAGATSRAFPIQSSSCGLPATAQAYSLNVTAVPHSTLNYLTTWPTGQPQPNVSTLNSSTGAVTANAAIVPAGSGGEVSVFVYDDADVILDVNGYFAAPATGGLSLYTTTPCRALDTRPTAFNGTIAVSVEGGTCAPLSTAQAYVLNATVVPQGPLVYLTLWPDGGAQPNVSTLNADDGAITSNMAIVPTNNGSIDAFSDGTTNLILDLSSYFAP